VSSVGVLRQFPNRVRRAVKRRCRYLVNFYGESRATKDRARATGKETHSTVALVPGDLVRVRSRQEIQATLNRWNQLKGCAFMEEMWPYCGTIQRVLRRVERFLDERDYLVKRCKGIVLLAGVICEGTKDFGPCDRCCFYFWREEWLEKLEESSPSLK